MADARCTGRMQGAVAQVQCRWCRRRFAVWTKVRGRRVTWHGAAREHAEREHRVHSHLTPRVVDLVREVSRC